MKVFHAGTIQRALPGNRAEIVTSGGRVLGVTSVGPTLESALTSAYRGAAEIHFDGMHYRKDIGGRAVALRGVTQ